MQNHRQRILLGANPRPYKVAQRLNQLRTLPEPLNVLIQVNLDDDPNKGGLDRQNTERLLEHVLAMPNLAPRGLMTILAKSTDSGVGYQLSLIHI